MGTRSWSGGSGRRCGWGFGGAELGEEVFDGEEALEVDELEDAELEVEAGLLAVAEVVEGAEEDGEEARELFFGEERGRACGAGAFFGGDLQEVGGEAVRGLVGREVGDFCDGAVAEVADELAGERLGAVAGVEEAAEDGKDVGGVVGVDGGEDLLEDDVGDGAHEGADFVGGECRDAVVDRGGGDGLIHDRQSIAHGAVAGFREEGECGAVGGDVFGGGDGAELADDVVELDGVKAEVLAARANGLRDVLGLRRGHHEDDVLGRLFEGFEKCVEGGVGDLVRLVEDVDLVLVAGGAIAGGVAELADLVDAAIGGSVNFDYVDGGP